MNVFSYFVLIFSVLSLTACVSCFVQELTNNISNTQWIPKKRVLWLSKNPDIPGNIDNPPSDEMAIGEEYALRFSGVGKLYTDKEKTSIEAVDDADRPPPHHEVLRRLSASTVAVVGIGGVGSWASEALARSGVGSIVLVDMDDICISNTNRQLHATSASVGKLKTEEMSRRISQIHPGCEVSTIFDFVTAANVDGILDDLREKRGVDVVIDAIDGAWEKTALVAGCVRRGIPVVTCGGAAGRKDPSKIVCEDLTRAREDRLLFRVRKTLRAKYRFPKGPGKGAKNYHNPRRWKIFAVFSDEVVGNGGGLEEASASFRQCDGTLGTASFVTGTYGFMAAGKAVEMITTGKMIVPKKVRMPLLELKEKSHQNATAQSIF